MEDWVLRDFLFHIKDLTDDERENCLKVLEDEGYATKRTAFLALTDDDLNKYGIRPGAVRKSILVAISQYRQPQVPYVGIETEGMKARKYISYRKETVRNVLCQVQQYGAVLIKAPPQSGKTSLLQLMHSEAATLGGLFRSVNYINVAAITKGTNFVKALQRKFPTTWQQFWDPDPQQGTGNGRLDLLLIDEAQIMYSNADDPLWAMLKVLQLGQVTNLRIIMAAMYGDAPSGIPQQEGSPPHTPIAFIPAATVTLQPSESPEQPSLSLTRAEYKELLDSFNTQCAHGGLQDPDLQEHLFNMTAGQVGMVTCVLDLILTKIRNQPSEPPLVDETARHVLNSESLYTALRIQRSFIKPEALDRCMDVIKAVLAGGETLSGEMKKVARRLAWSGLLVTNAGDSFSFATPLHENFYLVQVYRSRLPSIEDTSTDFSMFIERSIQRMSSKQLRESLSRGAGAKSRVYERHYQMEWYKSAVSLLPKSVSIAPDVGAMFGSKGFLDFWVSLSSDAGWGIELLCGGDRAEEHAQRFEEAGRYACMPMTAYALIDFREEGSRRVVKPRPKFYHVTFTHNFEAANIVHADGRSITVRLSE